MTKKNPFKKNKHEIKYNIINSALAGALVFLGSMTQGFSWEGIGIAFMAACTAAIFKFKNYWDEEKGEYTRNLFNFI